MVEGHQCHRVAHQHRKVLLGRSFKATSPNGRFTDGANAINGKTLERIEVIGKNLFYFFGSGAQEAMVHFHFGMSGAFKTHSLPGKDPTPTTRLQLVNEKEDIVAQLSAMTVNLGDMGLYEEKTVSLGPDPLREDADKERFWVKVSNTKKPIGLLLMDQSCIAGVGNIYRAEILFQARMHPEQPANTVSREKFEELWRWCVLDLQRGFTAGSILTVSPADAKRLGSPWTRRYIYNQSECGECGSRVRTWDMAARTVYACETCQPLAKGAELSSGRAKALAAATPTKVFKSHCAPDGRDTACTAKLSVKELKARLLSLGLPTDGRKADLLCRLDEQIRAKNGGGVLTAPVPAAADGVKKEEDELQGSAALTGPTSADGLSKMTVAALRAALKDAGLSTLGKKAELVARLAHVKPEGTTLADTPSAAAQALPVTSSAATKHKPEDDVVPGTQALGPVATAEEAELEKAKAGENRAVEHVALFTDRKAPSSASANSGVKGIKKRAAASGANDDALLLSASFRQRKSTRGSTGGKQK